VNSLGAKSILKNKSQSLAAGDIKAGAILVLSYDGTNFQILSGMSPLSQEASPEDDGGPMAGGAEVRTITCSFQPKTWRIVARCSDAGGDAGTGWVQGDEVDITGFIFHPGSGSDSADDNYRGSSVAAVYRTGSTIKVICHDAGASASGGWMVPHKTTGAVNTITRSRWTLKAYCYG
jgi:hypothetical protein